jgi:hypothetical protein
MADNELANVDVTPEDIDVESAEAAEAEPEQPAAEAAEAEAEPAPEPPTDEPPEPGEDDDLKKEVEKLKRRQLYLQRQLEKQPAPAATPAPEPEPELPATAPQESDFDTYEQYQTALIDFRVDQKVDQKIKSFEAEQAQKGTQQELAGFIQDLAQDGIGKYSDFEDVAMAVHVPITQPMIEILRECENPVEVAYHLGKNIKTAASISRMTRDAAVREMTKIDVDITKGGSTPSPKPERKVTSAPPPITPTKSENVITKDPDKMTQTEYEEWRRSGGGR